MKGTTARPPRQGFRRGLTELLYSLRTEAHTPLLQALSVATGVFIGCLPFYGFHLGACVVVNRLFRLNLVKMYLATNLNNPFSAPFLVYLEIQTGSLLRQGRFYEHTVESARNLVLRNFLFDILLGATAIGILLGAVFGLLTFIAVHRINRSPVFARLVDQTAHRYLESGLVRWEISRASLRFDPFYRAFTHANPIPDKGSLVHIECGNGLMLTYLDVMLGPRPEKSASPGALNLNLYGVDHRPKKVEIAQQVLGDRARIECANLEVHELVRHDVVVNLDRLKSVGRTHRTELLRRIATSVAPGGMLIIRASTAHIASDRWPATGLTEGHVLEVLKDLGPGFRTSALYRSLRRVVIVARRPHVENTSD